MSRTSSPIQQAHVPQPGTWQVLPETSEVGFSGRASRLAPTVRAAFSGVRGELLVDGDPDRSQVSIEIDLATLTTGNPVYDDILVRADPFRVNRHPVARFRSAQVRWTGDGVQVTGTLELSGTASVLTLTGSYRVRDPEDGTGTAELTATGRVATAILGRLSMPGASLLVPRTMSLVVRIIAERS